MGYPGEEVARFLGGITSGVVRVAHLEDLPEIEKYLYVGCETTFTIFSIYAVIYAGAGG